MRLSHLPALSSCLLPDFRCPVATPKAKPEMVCSTDAFYSHKISLLVVFSVWLCCGTKGGCYCTACQIWLTCSHLSLNPLQIQNNGTDVLG